jgi:hypothetical protein
MRKLWVVPVLCAVMAASPTPAPAKPKMIVQYLAEATSTLQAFTRTDVWLILPDGSHAKGTCLQSCTVEPPRLEKRVLFDCPGIAPKCIKDEWYYADRKGNDITIHTPTGSAVFHITGTW